MAQNENDPSVPPIGPLRRGGMMRPVVIAAKPEPTSDFVKVMGQETPEIQQKEGVEMVVKIGNDKTAGMFRATTIGNVKKDDETAVNSLQPWPVDESTINTKTTFMVYVDL